MGWTCPRCRTDYAEHRERCEADGWRLVENLTGKVIGERYHIDKLVGVGGMKGTVWRAMQQPTGRPVAIKFLPATSAEEAQRFERGARIASNLNHPHITTVHDYGTTPDGAFYLYADVSHLTNDSREFCQRMLVEAGVATTPGLDFDRQRGHGTLRISFAGSTAEMAEAVRRLERWKR